jgi:hypothetical protein
LVASFSSHSSASFKYGEPAAAGYAAAFALQACKLWQRTSSICCSPSLEALQCCDHVNAWLEGQQGAVSRGRKLLASIRQAHLRGGAQRQTRSDMINSTVCNILIQRSLHWMQRLALLNPSVL